MTEQNNNLGGNLAPQAETFALTKGQSLELNPEGLGLAPEYNGKLLCRIELPPPIGINQAEPIEPKIIDLVDYGEDFAQKDILPGYSALGKIQCRYGLRAANYLPEEGVGYAPLSQETLINSLWIGRETSDPGSETTNHLLGLGKYGQNLSAISQQHLKISMTETGQLIVQDNSTNGTKIEAAAGSVHRLANYFDPEAAAKIAEGMITVVPKPDELPKGGVPKTKNLRDALSAEKLQSIRDRVHWSADKFEALLEEAYDMVRQIGDSLLSEVDSTGDAIKLLDASRGLALPKAFKSPDGIGEKILATHSEERREIALHRPKLKAYEAVLKEHLSKTGIELKDPEDALFLLAINTVAHEAGHSVLSGIGKFIAQEAPSIDTNITRPLKASRMYLVRHPEAGITGNWLTDIKTQEERFAEGYGQLVLGRVMEELGYDERAQQAIFNFLDNKVGLYDSPQGEQAVDFVNNLSPEKSLSQVADEAGIKMSDADLGYGMRFTPDELAEVLKDLYQVAIKAADQPPAITPNIHEWCKAVKGGQSASTKKLIARQLAIRAAAPSSRATKNEPKIIDANDIPR